MKNLNSILCLPGQTAHLQESLQAPGGLEKQFHRCHSLPPPPLRIRNVGGGFERIDADKVEIVPPDTNELLALKQALDALALHGPRKTELAKL